ncbi:MAG: HEAT repeat domain-containing protein [Rhodothermales bacterium]
MNFDALIIDQPLYGSLMVLADLFLKGLLILAGARLLTAFLSKSAAAARHLIWATALVMILLLPVFSVVLPKMTVPLLKQPFQASSATEGAARLAPDGVLEDQALATWKDDAGIAVDKSRSAAPLGITEGRTSAGHASDAREPAALPAPVTSQSIASDEVIRFWAPFAAFFSKAHWTTIVLGLWAFGALGVLSWTLIGICGAWWITRDARSPESEDWADLNDELADRLLVYRPVKLLMSTSISSPMTWGVWRPVILLPIDADDWSDERRRYVLLHEMAHIKRWDTLTQFAAQLSCALHWFNPLAWRGLHKLRIEQEKSCDDLVLSHGMKASEYARHLLDIARSLKMSWVSPLNTISMAKPSQLEGRVVDILDPSRKKRTINRMGGVFTCALALSVMLPISALSPWEETREILPGISAEEPLETGRRGNALVTGSKERRLREPLGIARLPKAELETRTSGLTIWQQDERVARADTSEKQRRARKMAVQALRNSLDDENAEVRRHAAMTLAEMDDAGSADALIKLLQTDTNADVRRTAIIALNELGSHKAIDAFLIASNDSNAKVRQFAVMALSELDDKRAVDALISVLDDSNANVRRHAVIGITEHGSEDMSRILLKMLDDQNSDVRRLVLMGLAERRNPEALPAIMKALDDSNAEIRRYAVIALGEYDDPGATLMLRKALKDTNSKVRQHAMMVLVDHADDEDMPLFIDLLLNDKNADVRKHAAVALGEIGNIEAVDALSKALSDKNSEVRRCATMALSELDYGNDNWDEDDEWGADDWEDDEWDNNDWENTEWENSAWENSEDFGKAMAEIGVSASKFGLAVGEMSLNLTSDVLAELSYSLDNLEFDTNELASLKEELYMSEVELQEHMYELESLQLELDKEWNEESFESILEMFDELEPLFNASPELCEKAVSIFYEKEERVRERAMKRLECRRATEIRN